MNLFFSRARLRKDASSAALAKIFLPEDADRRISVAHKLLWTLFADGANRRRDFLWRESAPGTFYLLSQRPPEDSHALFDIDEPKPFSPVLNAGDRLGFSLRANPTVARKNGADRGKRSDVVMDTIKNVSKAQRAETRRTAIQDAGSAWLRRQGERNGFSVEAVRADGYRILRAPRGSTATHIATVDFEGFLRVVDGPAFTATLARGFGHAKAFGCGLMLIRRA